MEDVAEMSESVLSKEETDTDTWELNIDIEELLPIGRDVFPKATDDGIRDALFRSHTLARYLIYKANRAKPGTFSGEKLRYEEGFPLSSVFLEL